MKELSIKEKAKRYDEAIERVNSKWKYKNQTCVVNIAEIFPELKESEGEKIADAIRKALESKMEDLGNGVTKTACLAWLEKQCEQKPSDKELKELLRAEYDKGKADALKEKNPTWSEEDEERIKNIISVLDVQVCWDGATGKKGNPYQKEIDWLKSLKDRVQPKQEWSEEDESMLNDIMHNIHFAETHRNVTGSSDMEKDQVNWLKSLKNRINL